MNDHMPAQANAEGVRMRGDGYTAEAGWFGPEDRPRFGWLHRPDTPASNHVGIVIVPPFGREDICAHRTLRHLAEDAAKAGFVAVRFDLDGTGDSAGDNTDPDRVAAWIASIRDACDLARGSGATQLVLVGVRLGATLATLAAPDCPDVAALVAFNAVTNGKAYLRELRAFQSAMNLAPPPSPSPAVETGQETSGFLISDETCTALKAIDLAATETAPAPMVRVLERDDLPGRGNWADHLRSFGIDVAVQRISGYVEMMDDPHAGRVAQAFLEACIDCARSLPATNRDGVTVADPQSLRPSVRHTVDGTAIVEEVVAPGGSTFGVLTRPADVHATQAVLLLNAGAVRHIGSNRIDVPLARRLAASGLQVLRADLTGIGDSPARAGESENIVYGSCCLDDVGVLVAWLRTRGAHTLAAGGMCSGAYHALRAAVAGQAIDNIFLINCLVYSREVKFDPEAGTLLGDIAHYNQAVKSGQAWRRLLTGKVALATVLRVLAWHIGNRVARVGRNLGRKLRLPMRDDLGYHLLALARRDSHVHFLFSAHESGQNLLAAEAGAVLQRLTKAGKIDTRVFDGADHTFTQRWAQARLHGALMDVLTRSPASDRQAPCP